MFRLYAADRPRNLKNRMGKPLGRLPLRLRPERDCDWECPGSRRVA